ncbi:MAG: ATP-dependent DNA helicase RecG [Bacteroidota bacterium]
MQRRDFFDTPIEYLKGVGPQRGDILKKEFSIFTFEDLLHHYPFRYIDRSKFYKINELNAEMPYLQIKGKLSRIQSHGDKRTTRITAVISDETGSLELVWFQGLKWAKNFLKPQIDYIVFGKPSSFNGKINIVHPEIEEVAKAELFKGPSLTGVYSVTEKARATGLDTKAIVKLQRTLIAALPPFIQDVFPSDVLQHHDLMSLRDAYVNIHFPKNEMALRLAIRRLKFDELFFVQLRLLRAKAHRNETYRGKMITKIGDVFNSFYTHYLPFELTNAQKRVLKEIRSDMGTGKQMNRLLQGDVGSGKTMVALLSILMVLDNGFQACLMAPTEILANQHYQSISELLNPLAIQVELLTGSTKAAKRREVLQDLSDGNLKIIIGTHALIEERVQFKDLGLVVIDEQHRFGVQQRAKLWMKDGVAPHVLVMTATPIPRTLAMTLYGDLETSVIDELPPGRKPITTSHRFESARLPVLGFMKSEIAKGRQVYIVYPLIEESEKLDYSNLFEGYEAICKEFPLPNYKVSIVHGKMKPAEKDAEMKRFVNGETNIMVATTVIEVGVNVPNASIMIIESAERFGLSQLHQLRGRVGRGADQSYCILMTGNKLSNESRLRLRTMCDTNNGFEIAEVDLKLRGPGDITGTQQSGVVDLHIADLSKDRAIMEEARGLAEKIINADSKLQDVRHVLIREKLMRMETEKTNFSRVS